ncbi:VTT domain-containing protein [Streptomyces sp. NPDC046197]|uniref:DedA family protein n=1 Tax=Streptomyces sp. NPDC046197 TaxID=3154337 RepID=UPI0033D97E74
MTTLALGPSWLDPNHLLDTFGIWGLLLVVFAESGLLIGFFLPGDSLLFTCGLLITSHQMHFPLWGAIALICLAAVLGDQAGYMFGKKVGPSLFNRPDSRLFKQENITKAHEFFEKYGPKSLILARFVPVVRTFTPIVAGVSGMRYRSFVTFNVIGGVLWGAGVTLLGSWLGNVGVVKNNIEAILILISLVSVVPIGIEFLRARSKSGKAPKADVTPARDEPYLQQPVMDDATTRLRRVEPTYQDQHQDQYQHQDQHHSYGDQSYGNQPYADQSYGNQPYADQPHGNQPYADQPHGNQPYANEPYGNQPYQPYDNQGHQQQYGYDQYYGQQHPQQQYGTQQDTYDPHQQQYPYNDGYHRAP